MYLKNVKKGMVVSMLKSSPYSYNFGDIAVVKGFDSGYYSYMCFISVAGMEGEVRASPSDFTLVKDFHGSTNNRDIERGDKVRLRRDFISNGKFISDTEDCFKPDEDFKIDGVVTVRKVDDKGFSSNPEAHYRFYINEEDFFSFGYNTHFFEVVEKGGGFKDGTIEKE